MTVQALTMKAPQQGITPQLQLKHRSQQTSNWYSLQSISFLRGSIDFFEKTIALSTPHRNHIYEFPLVRWHYITTLTAFSCVLHLPIALACSSCDSFHKIAQIGGLLKAVLIGVFLSKRSYRRYFPPFFPDSWMLCQDTEAFCALISEI